MSNQAESVRSSRRPLVVAILNFLQSELRHRDDWLQRDRERISSVIRCLERLYVVDAFAYAQHRVNRPLLDIYREFANPVTVRDRIRAEAHKNLGNRYMKQGMFFHAEIEYSNAIDLHRWDSIYYCNRASAYIEQRNFAEAMADCFMASALNPEYAKAYGRMGQSCLILHNPVIAGVCFLRALELDPGNATYISNLRKVGNQIVRSNDVWFIGNLQNSPLRLRPPSVHDKEEEQNVEEARTVPDRKNESNKHKENKRNEKGQNGNGHKEKQHKQINYLENEWKEKAIAQISAAYSAFTQQQKERKEGDPENNNTALISISKFLQMASHSKEHKSDIIDNTVPKHTFGLGPAGDVKTTSGKSVVVPGKYLDEISRKAKSSITQSNGYNSPLIQNRNGQSSDAPTSDTEMEVYIQVNCLTLTALNDESTADRSTDKNGQCSAEIIECNAICPENANKGNNSCDIKSNQEKTSADDVADEKNIEYSKSERDDEKSADDEQQLESNS